MIDWHCHILPGLDDGPKTADEALSMARSLSAAGFTRVCCTPHSSPGLYDNRPEGVKDATRLLQQQLDAEAVSITLHPAMEYWLDEFLIKNPDELLLLPGRLLLVEIPQRSDREFVVDTLYQLIRKRITPLIAHPERCDLLYLPSQPSAGLFSRIGRIVKGSFAGSRERETGSTLLKDLQMMGCSFQGNLGSFAGYYGEAIRSRAEGFLAGGIYTHFGSDLHSLRQSHILQVCQRLPMEG